MTERIDPLERLRRTNPVASEDVSFVPGIEDICERILETDARMPRIGRETWAGPRVSIFPGPAGALAGVLVVVLAVGAAWLFIGRYSFPIPDNDQPQRALRTTGTAKSTGAAAWVLLPEAPVKSRYGHSAIWTGEEMIVWGGTNASDGAAYSVMHQGWRTLADSPLGPRSRHTAVWTNREMIIWGGEISSRPSAEGAAYEPATDSWRLLASSPLDSERWFHSAVWTGREMVIWGSAAEGELLGAAYDSISNRWRMLPESPIGDRNEHSAVWTGEEVIIWGGWVFDPQRQEEMTLSDGAAYNPVTDTWRLLPEAPIEARFGHSGVWTGEELVIWGGAASPSTNEAWNDGAAYNPASNSWRALADSPLSARYDHSAFSTAVGVVIWGGHIRTSVSSWRQFADGALLHKEEWELLPAAPVAGTVSTTPAAWTGKEIVFWGQGDDFQTTLGATYSLIPEGSDGAG